MVRKPPAPPGGWRPQGVVPTQCVGLVNHAKKRKSLRPLASVRSTRRAGEGRVSGSSEMHGHAEARYLFGVRTFTCRVPCPGRVCLGMFADVRRACPREQRRGHARRTSANMPRQRRPGHATLQVNVRTLNRCPDPPRILAGGPTVPRVQSCPTRVNHQTGGGRTCRTMAEESPDVLS